MSDTNDGRDRRRTDRAASLGGNPDGVPWAQEMFTLGERQQLRLWTPEPPSPDRGRSPWHWLLVIPVAAPLLIPWYNRAGPTLLGLPFFYWCQLAFIPLSIVVIAVVCVATRRQD